MSVVNYQRVDLHLIIRRSDKGWLVRFGFPGKLGEKHISAEELEGWFNNYDLPVTALTGGAPVTELLTEMQKRRASIWNRASKTGEPSQVILRLALDIAPVALRQYEWEARLAAAFKTQSPENLLIVRVSEVKPRISLTPFTLPLRILQVSPSPEFSVRERVREVFGQNLPETDLSKAVHVESAAFESFESATLSVVGPTTEVLHFDDLPTLDEPEILLSTANPEKPGTLGWFSRVVDARQTRLIVIDCEWWRIAAARRLAAAIVDRSGPAVLVSGCHLKSEKASFYRIFYDQLIHDYALDFCVFDSLNISGYTGKVGFFAGAGREELLRVSSIGERLIGLGKMLASRKRKIIPLERLSELIVRNAPKTEPPASMMSLSLAKDIVANSVRHISGSDYPIRSDNRLSELEIYNKSAVDLFNERVMMDSAEQGFDIDRAVLEPVTEDSRFHEIVEIVIDNAVPLGFQQDASLTPQAVESSIEQISSTLENLEQKWNSWHFEFHEGEGLVPLSREMTVLRGQAGVESAVSYDEVAPKAREPRYVNSGLWQISDSGTTSRLDQTTARLTTGRTYHLGIQIGPKDARIFTLGETALIEEVFKWTPEMKGTWVEIGVTGIDFEVLGDPVQEVWLPRETPSDIVYFAVVPRTTDVARLRFGLYHKQNLVQSFLLAALIGTPDNKQNPTKKQRKLLSRALGAKPKQVGDFGYLTRLEFSLTASMDEIESRGERTLSILVNDSMGEPRITVKGAGEFETAPLGNELGDYVNAVRETLEQVSFTEISQGTQKLTVYNFPKDAKPQILKDSLKKLASVGWMLFDIVMPGDEDERNRINALLEKEKSIIQVAHVLREKVIPWAALYDTEYDKSKNTDENSQPVANDVCLAALPRPDGTLPTAKCGEMKECLLHKDRAANRKAQNLPPFCENTVVCPLHFWGFKHIIEVPPQQVTNNSPVPQIDCIKSDGNIRLLAGINSKLKMGATHWDALNLLVKSTPNAQWKPKETRCQPLLHALKDVALDFIYLYCHAHGGFPPYLEFYDDVQKAAEQLRPDQLGLTKWEHNPLVFLNGCETVGFRPDAISPFIKKIVEHRKASGIIGTEVTIREELATETALLFLEKFLAGQSAGDALLFARRRLLAQNNPLGLVYTLFAAAHLRIETGSGGQSSDDA